VFSSSAAKGFIEFTNHTLLARCRFSSAPPFGILQFFPCLHERIKDIFPSGQLKALRDTPFAFR
jgi:hypothetical protein